MTWPETRTTCSSPYCVWNALDSGYPHTRVRAKMSNATKLGPAHSSRRAAFIRRAAPGLDVHLCTPFNQRPARDKSWSAKFRQALTVHDIPQRTPFSQRPARDKSWSAKFRQHVRLSRSSARRANDVETISDSL
ncbi:hypothetical protein EXIGLDRAFT_123367 [Exidia glandulosa HHB12029]|uniref:Uncharacterized protein n=1 Tax=Exidia glandulosa HHB12029 TaxID=1314781 RepID=A0A165NJP9_EXIGL|nr:hypothetical protein EXIGLDRAFT_123367 [Exidia glandulosa HHB12029]